MDKFVITDESSPFNWVGSVGAGPCIIILIHAIDQSGKKMVACGHLSDSRSPLSICSMLDKMNASQILSVHLVSAETPINYSVPQQLLALLQERGAPQPQVSLGKGVSQAGMDVHTGQIIYDVPLSMENAGVTELPDDDDYEEIYARFPHDRNARPHIELSLDGRCKADIEKIHVLLANAEPPLQNAETHNYRAVARALHNKNVFTAEELKALLWNSPPEVNELGQSLEKMFMHGFSFLRSDREKALIALRLALKLKNNLKEFFEKTPEEQLALKEFFKQSFLHDLHSEDKVMAEHRAYWKVIVANVFIAFTVVGLFAMASNYFLNGQALFFSRTKRELAIESVEQSPWLETTL